jgi:hypothetical protein
MDGSAIAPLPTMAEPTSPKLILSRFSSAERPADPPIPIKKGHVRRAMRAADQVYAEAKNPLGDDTEPGVVLMTAVLLVERLAQASGCDPGAVLHKMADCFEFKRRYANNMKDCS